MDLVGLAIWQGYWSHFPSQMGEIAGITEFLQFSVGFSPHLGGGAGLGLKLGETSRAVPLRHTKWIWLS